MTDVLFVTLVPVALIVAWAWFYFVVTRDRGQVDGERVFIVDLDRLGNSAVMHVGPRTWENMKANATPTQRFNGEPIPTMFPDVFMGMPVHVSDQLASRTRW